MTSERRTWMILMVVALTGCAPGDDGSGVNPGPDPEPPPDAEPEPPMCAGDACGLPDTPDCCDGTMCINFGAAHGDVHCAIVTEQVEDCDSGCLQETADGDSICAPEEWCGVAGIVPEALCDRADACDWGGWQNESACTPYYDNCVGGLSTSGQIAWINQVNACLSNTSCQSFASCMSYVDVCW